MPVGQPQTCTGLGVRRCCDRGTHGGKLTDLHGLLPWGTIMALVINGRFLTRPITGVERYGHMLLQVIAKEWPDSRVVLPARAEGDVDTYGLDVVRHTGLGGHAWEQLQLPSALRKDDLLLSPANTGPLRVRRQVVVVHDLAVIHHPEWFDRRFARWYEFLLPRLTRRVARVITVSSTSSLDLQQTYSLGPGHVTIVPPFATRLPIGERSDRPVPSPYCLLVGSLDPRKGIDRALQWYSSLKDPLFSLVIVGRPGPQFASLDTAQHEGVHFLHGVHDADLRGLYEGALALLHPSRAEGFGLPVLEAMEHGCPVIASDLQVFRECFGDAVRYSSFAMDTSLDEALKEVLGPEREAWIEHGKRHAATFDETRITQALHNAIDPLLRS